MTKILAGIILFYVFLLMLKGSEDNIRRKKEEMNANTMIVPRKSCTYFSLRRRLSSVVFVVVRCFTFAAMYIIKRQTHVNTDMR